jgi:hypothetical protein
MDSGHFFVQLHHILAEKFWRRLTTPSPEDELTLLRPNKKMPGILWNPKIHCRLRNIRPLVLIICHINPVHAPSFILILYSSLLLILPTSGLATRSQTVFVSLSPYCIIPSHCHLPSFYISRNIRSGAKNYKAPRHVVFSLPCHLIPLTLRYLPQHPTLEQPQPIHKGLKTACYVCHSFLFCKSYTSEFSAQGGVTYC